MADYVLTTPSGATITLGTSGAPIVTLYVAEGATIAGLEVFVPPRNPDIGAGLEEVANLNIAKFGDGYSQRTPKGINFISSTIPARWGMLNKNDRDKIIRFFRNKGGYVAFWYGLPGEILRKYVCQKWSSAEKAMDLWEVSATFEQVFDLDNV